MRGSTVSRCMVIAAVLASCSCVEAKDLHTEWMGLRDSYLGGSFVFRCGEIYRVSRGVTGRYELAVMTTEGNWESAKVLATNDAGLTIPGLASDKQGLSPPNDMIEFIRADIIKKLNDENGLAASDRLDAGSLSIVITPKTMDRASTTRRIDFFRAEIRLIPDGEVEYDVSASSPKASLKIPKVTQAYAVPGSSMVVGRGWNCSLM